MYETYTVKPGDTLYGISNQFGVTVTELAELNGIKGSNLPVGTVLRIPNKSGVNPDNITFVGKGETTQFSTTDRSKNRVAVVDAQ